jgi:hypothetical protein
MGYLERAQKWPAVRAEIGLEQAEQHEKRRSGLEVLDNVRVIEKEHTSNALITGISSLAVH